MKKRHEITCYFLFALVILIFILMLIGADKMTNNAIENCSKNHSTDYCIERLS